MIRPQSLLPLALLAAGCTEGGGGLLDVSFDRLDVQAIDFDGADADFVFRIENNTAFGLSLQNSTTPFSLPMSSGSPAAIQTD